MASIINIRASGTGGSESGLASIDVPQDGLLMGVSMTMHCDADADGDVCFSQVSFGSTISTANDSRQVIAEVRSSVQLTTSGSPQTAVNMYVPYANGIPVAMGERIFLHANATAALPSVHSHLLIFDFDEPRPSARRR